MEKFESYPIQNATASGTTFSSAAGKQAEDIVNVGQRYIRVVDDHGTESWAKFQMWRGFGQEMTLGGVQRPRPGLQRPQDVLAGSAAGPTALICG